MIIELRAQLVRDADEEGLQRELGGEVELLELPPGLAGGLGRAFGADEPLAGRVGPELLEPVDVDGGRLRADRDDDEVAVPGLELLELRE